MKAVERESEALLLELVCFIQLVCFVRSRLAKRMKLHIDHGDQIAAIRIGFGWPLAAANGK